MAGALAIAPSIKMMRLEMIRPEKSKGNYNFAMKAVCVSNSPYITGDEFVTHKPLSNLQIGKRYNATLEGEWLRVWDDFDEDYLYPLHMFRLESG